MAKIVKVQIEVEGRWHEEEVLVEPNDLQPWQADREMAHVGAGRTRIDGEARVTGTAIYTYDVILPGMLWAKVLRSPHPHARIKSIDTSKAEAHPGVKAVMTAKDIVNFPIEKSVMLGIQDMRWMCRNVMAREKALFAGHPVAAVAAASSQPTVTVTRDGDALGWTPATSIADGLELTWASTPDP